MGRDISADIYYGITIKNEDGIFHNFDDIEIPNDYEEDLMEYLEEAISDTHEFYITYSGTDDWTEKALVYRDKSKGYDGSFACSYWGFQVFEPRELINFDAAKADATFRKLFDKIGLDFVQPEFLLVGKYR